jgi:hypothetical protein
MAETKEIAKRTPEDERRLTLERIVPLINPQKDFATFGNNVEPTRDLMLKLLKSFNLSHDTEIVETTQTRFIMKAVVWDEAGHKSASHGLCTLKEVQNTPRKEHDAMTKAETRAIKRAIESLSGASVINQLILHFYGGFQTTPKQHKPEPHKPTIEEVYKKCLAGMDAMQNAHPEEYTEKSWEHDKQYIDECKKQGFYDKLMDHVHKLAAKYRELEGEDE